MTCTVNYPIRDTYAIRQGKVGWASLPPSPSSAPSPLLRWACSHIPRRSGCSSGYRRTHRAACVLERANLGLRVPRNALGRSPMGQDLLSTVSTLRTDRYLTDTYWPFTTNRINLAEPIAASKLMGTNQQQGVYYHVSNYSIAVRAANSAVFSNRPKERSWAVGGNGGQVTARLHLRRTLLLPYNLPNQTLHLPNAYSPSLSYCICLNLRPLSRIACASAT